MVYLRYHEYSCRLAHECMPSCWRCCHTLHHLQAETAHMPTVYDLIQGYKRHIMVCLSIVICGVSQASPAHCYTGCVNGQLYLLAR